MKQMGLLPRSGVQLGNPPGVLTHVNGGLLCRLLPGLGWE